MRHLMVWWCSTVSVVNVIYGSFATMILILVGIEVAALIVLLGAQVIAEYERIGMNLERDSGFHI
jgi:membrane protein